MKSGKLWLLVLIAGVAVLAAFAPRILKPAPPATEVTTKQSENSDLTAIKTFTGRSDLDVTFVNTDLPTPYFRVGKVTKVGGGENMDPVEGWTRKVNVYDQKDLIDGKCSVYEYHTDERNHSLVAVLIKGLKPIEIDELSKNGITCKSESGSMPKISKTEAEVRAMEYLTRSIPNLNQIINDFKYTTQQNGESHEWLWEDKSFKLPEGVSSRPYSGPIIRISVYGDNEIQYWNTVSLFEN
jgi:hypothetical protein